MEKPQKISKFRHVVLWIEGTDAVTSLATFLKDNWKTTLVLANASFGVVGTLLGKLAGIAVPFTPLFFTLAAAGLIITLPLAWMLRVAIRQDSEVAVAGSVTHPDDWEWTSDEGYLQIPPKPRKATPSGGPSLDMVAPDQGVESVAQQDGQSEGLEPATFNSHTIDRLGELRADAVAAMQALTELLDQWINELRTDSDPYSYAGLLHGTIRDPMVSARGALDRLRGSTDGDALIRGISAAFKAYLHARGSIHTCAKAAGHSIDEKPSYDKWHAADTNFLHEVTRVRSVPSLRALDLQMNETLAGDSAVEAFPPPPSRWS